MRIRQRQSRALGISVILLLAAPAFATNTVECQHGGSETQTAKLSGYSVKLSAVPHTLETGVEVEICKAQVIPPIGEPIFSIEHWDVRMNEISGNDLNGDGHPEIVLEGYSGGMHCCWTFWIVSLGQPPGLLVKLENDYVTYLEDADGDGRFEIRALDGSFDYFDGISHVESWSGLMPEAFVRLEGNTVKEVGAEFSQRFDKRLEKARAFLDPESLRKFRRLRSMCSIVCNDPKSPIRDKLSDEDRAILRSVKSAVLTTVLAYLYSGREEQAWKALDEMWPETDKERIRKLIVEARSCGILNAVYSSCPRR